MSNFADYVDEAGITRLRAKSPGGGSIPGGALLATDYLFTEVADAGTYAATLAVPAGTTVKNVLIYNQSPWAADSAYLFVGDGLSGDTPPDEYIYALQLDVQPGGLDGVYGFAEDWPGGGGTPPEPAAGSAGCFSDVGQSALFYSSGAYVGNDSVVTDDVGNQWLVARDPFTPIIAAEAVKHVNGDTSVTRMAVTGQVIEPPGVPYRDDQTITLTIQTTNAVPVAPSGETRVRILHFAPVTAVAATFS